MNRIDDLRNQFIKRDDRNFCYVRYDDCDYLLRIAEAAEAYINLPEKIGRLGDSEKYLLDAYSMMKEATDNLHKSLENRDE